MVNSKIVRKLPEALCKDTAVLILYFERAKREKGKKDNLPKKSVAGGNCSLLHQLYSLWGPTLLTLLTTAITWVLLVIYISGPRSPDFVSKTPTDITWICSVSSHQHTGWHFSVVILKQNSYPWLFSDNFEVVLSSSTGNGSNISAKQILKEEFDSQSPLTCIFVLQMNQWTFNWFLLHQSFILVLFQRMSEREFMIKPTAKIAGNRLEKTDENQEGRRGLGRVLHVKAQVLISYVQHDSSKK